MNVINQLGDEAMKWFREDAHESDRDQAAMGLAHRERP